jgi:hypothetical protein
MYAWVIQYSVLTIMEVEGMVYIRTLSELDHYRARWQQSHLCYTIAS